MSATRMAVRILSGVIDLLMVYLPASLLVHIIFPESGNMGRLITQVLFVVCNVVLAASFDGKTIGKYFSKERIYFDGSYSVIHLGIRELAKSLYFAPFIDVFSLMISMILLSLTGRSLHDFIGNSKVVLEKEYRKIKNQEDDYEKGTLRRESY